MSQQVLLEGGQILDTGTRTALSDGYLLVDGGRVVEFGPVEDLDASVDPDRRIDITGRTAMPGIVDAHAHLSYTAETLRDGLGFTNPKNSLEYNAIGATKSARDTLSRGVTSIRDIGSRGGIAVAVRDAVEDGLVPGPRVVASGPILTTTAGLTDVHPPWIEEHAGFRQRIDGVDEAIRAVREQAKLGVDNVKVEASGEWIAPFADSTTRTMREDEIRAVVEEAHARDMTVAAHAKAKEAIENAARAGVDTVEHGTFLDAEAAALLRENDVALVGTLTGQTDIAEKAVEEGDQPEELVEQLRAEIQTLRDAVRLAHEEGVTVLTGTDSGPPHSAQGNTGEEVAYLVEYGGFDPMEAIVAGTETTAEAVGLSDVGTLEPGAVADVVVLDGDPLADPGLLADPGNVTSVLKAGTPVEAV
jgi:imidazolonepropionase-like amidohydrolase